VNIKVLGQMKRNLHVALSKIWVKLPSRIKLQLRRSALFKISSLWILEYANAKTASLIEVDSSREYVIDFDVVVTSHKQSHFLLECLSSLMGQTHLPNNVFVIVHDEDKDEELRSKAIVSTFATEIQLTILTIPECWPGEARNFGASLSSSDAIIFIDADDKIEKDYFFNALLYMNYYNADFVGAWCQTFGKDIQPEIWKIPFRPLLENYTSSNGSPVSSLIRRSTFNKVSGWRDYDAAGIKIDEALDFWRRVKLAGGEGINIQNSYINLRRHNSNRSSEASEKKFFDSAYLAKEMISYRKEFLRDNVILDPELTCSYQNLERFLNLTFSKDSDAVMIFMADAKPFGAGKVFCEIASEIMKVEKQIILVNLDINGLGFGVEKLDSELANLPIIELGNACTTETWNSFLKSLLKVCDVGSLVSFGHPFANELMVSLQSEFDQLRISAFMFNTESVHANWIAKNPNKLDYLLLENTHSLNWTLEHGWSPEKALRVHHKAHRISNTGGVMHDELDFGKKPLQILWFHRFASEKQPEQFLKMAVMSSDQNLPIEFLMGGEGPLREKFVKRAALLSNIQILGEEVGNYEALSLADFLMSTSSSVEGRPLIISEALESGVNVLIPNLPSLLDFEKEGYLGIYNYLDLRGALNLLKDVDPLILRLNRETKANLNKEITDAFGGDDYLKWISQS
jgi:glycosyltransferase involved in cell wall biosynthesis